MVMRIASSNAYDLTIGNINAQQVSLTNLQDHLSSGKAINHASDDPANAALAERMTMSQTQITSQQGALTVQKDSMTQIESTLGDSVSALQEIRRLMVNAGDATMTSTNRASLAQQITALRNQMLGYANTVGTNGVPIFGGLGSSATPFTDSAAGVQYNGNSGQRTTTASSIPSTMDGQAVWLNVKSGNGVFQTSLGATNTGKLWTDPGTVSNPASLTGDSYQVVFNVSATTPPVTTYNVVDQTTATTLSTNLPYTDGQAIQVAGMSFTPHGAPANGDVVNLAPSTRTSVFSVVDAAANAINNAGNSNVLTQNISLALAQIDSSIAQLTAAQGAAGTLLNQADSISTNQENLKVQISGDLSNTQDLNMVQAISAFQNQQTSYQAALQSYAQVQKMSLFNYLG